MQYKKPSQKRQLKSGQIAYSLKRKKQKIARIEKELRKLKKKNQSLQKELKAIKPGEKSKKKSQQKKRGTRSVARLEYLLDQKNKKIKRIEKEIEKTIYFDNKYRRELEKIIHRLEKEAKKDEGGFQEKNWELALSVASNISIVDIYDSLIDDTFDEGVYEIYVSIDPLRSSYIYTGRLDSSGGIVRQRVKLTDKIYKVIKTFMSLDRYYLVSNFDKPYPVFVFIQNTIDETISQNLQILKSKLNVHAATFKVNFKIKFRKIKEENLSDSDIAQIIAGNVNYTDTFKTASGTLRQKYGSEAMKRYKRRKADKERKKEARK